MWCLCCWSLVTGYYVKPFTPDPHIYRLEAVKEKFPDLSWETINRYYCSYKLVMSGIIPALHIRCIAVDLYKRELFLIPSPSVFTELKYSDERYLNAISVNVISHIEQILN